MGKSYSLASLGIAETPSVGKIGLANEAAFDQTHLSQPLTDFATGFKDEKLEGLLEFIAPKTKAARRFEYRTRDSKDAFAMVADGSDIRAIGAEFTVLRAQDGIVQAKTQSKGLTFVLDKDQDVPGKREEVVKDLKKLLIRADIIRAMALLEAASTNSNVTWTGANASNPDADLITKVAAFGDVVGQDANRVLFGSTAWAKRMGYVLSHAAQIPGTGSVQGLADLIGVDSVMKGSMRVTVGSGKQQKVTTNGVYIFSGEAGAGLADSSTLKTFYTPAEGGAEYSVFIVEKAATVEITVGHFTQVATTCSEGVQKLTVS